MNVRNYTEFIVDLVLAMGPDAFAGAVNVFRFHDERRMIHLLKARLNDEQLEHFAEKTGFRVVRGANGWYVDQPQNACAYRIDFFEAISEVVRIES